MTAVAQQSEIGALRKNRTCPGITLREWLDYLEQSNQLSVAHPRVKLKHELAAIGKRLDGERACLFPQPGGHAIPVVTGLLSHREWIADAVGVSTKELLGVYQSALRNPLPCQTVENAPVQEVVHATIDLTKQLPIPTHNEHDAGPYLSAAVLIMRNPLTGAQNVSINRCQQIAPDRFGVLIATRDTRLFYDAAEKAGVDVEVAIVIGASPLVMMASQFTAPSGQDELEIAGALADEPLRVTKCRSNNVLVPADAEIVLEGRMRPKVREAEGPFGEFPQVYGPQGQREVIEVECVTHRKDPIFQTIVSGCREHLLLGSIPREAVVLSRLQWTFPNVKNVHLPLGGFGRFHIWVQIQKRHDGEGKNIMLSALSAHFDFKFCVIVDDDINVFDREAVDFAIATRYRADEQTLIVSNAQCSKLDPVATNGVGSKIGIDATKPMHDEPMRYKRIAVPGEHDIDLSAALQKNPDNWRKTLHN